jgi:eukaryotic-like serine/threonine-protein kinase
LRATVPWVVREASFGTRVTHPNVIRTLQTGEENGLHFLAIEWAEGELLETYAKRNAPFPPDEVAAVITQLASAVYAAHAVGIVHRDLKPDNAMYHHDSRTLKLLDFGIATATDVTPDQRLTRAGFFVGTLMYVAPEALSGEVVSPAADQYSLATMAYQFLTGTLPYTAKSPREMFTQLLSQPPIPLNKAKPEHQYSALVEEVVMKGLAKEPAQRYPDVNAFAAALTEALATTMPEEQPTAGFMSRMKGLFGR